jgi:hypothetical protein
MRPSATTPWTSVFFNKMKRLGVVGTLNSVRSANVRDGFVTAALSLARQSRRHFSSFAAIGLLAFAGLLTGCDFVAEKELKAGLSTKEDVIARMGKPEMIWEEKDGSAKYEYPRGPEGHQTWMVSFAPDGRYLGMENILNETTFAKIQPGMSRDDVRKIVGKPGKSAVNPLTNQEQWTWRYQERPSEGRMFHVIMTRDGQVVKTERSDDPRDTGGGK